MSIIYNDLDNDFTLIPNVILQDTRVSGLAFKMYSYIAFRLGRNKEWEFYNREIISHFKEGRDAVMKARNELLDLGYLQVVKQNKSISGKFLGNDYIIRKNPKSPHTENQFTESPSTESPHTENQFTNNKDKKNKDINKKDCIAEQSNFSQNETLVLTKDNLAKEWEGHFKVKPSEEQEDKFLHFWNTMGKAKKDKYKNCWQTYFHTFYKLEEKYPNAKLNPLKIAEQEALEVEKRLGEMRSEKEEVEKYFAKNEYDTNLTNVFQEKVKETRGENTLKQIEDVKVVEFSKEKRCIVLSGSEASRNMIYIHYNAWINKLKLGVSFSKIYCLTLEEIKKYKQKELDLNEVEFII